MRIAVTGHMDISEESVELVRSAILNHLESHAADGPLTGISCLAKGADSIFAEAVLRSGGALEVVLPSPNYRDRKVKPDDAPLFDRLVAEARFVDILPFDDVNKEAYEAANDALVGSCDRLLAVWDGNKGNRSGTATVVEQAQKLDVPTTVIWPVGAVRGG